MNKQIYKLPVYLLIGGIIRIAIMYGIQILGSIGDIVWIIDKEIPYLVIKGSISVTIFIIIGLKIAKIYDRKTCFKSASLVVCYGMIALCLDQLLDYLGKYGLSIMAEYSQYVPTEMETLYTMLFEAVSGEPTKWLYVIPMMFTPYLFVLFTKENLQSVKK